MHVLKMDGIHFSRVHAKNNHQKIEGKLSTENRLRNLEERSLALLASLNN